MRFRVKFSDQLYKVIFEADTRSGKTFDIALIICIILSVLVIFVDSISPVGEDFEQLLFIVEWTFTILFTLEYGARIYCSPKPLSYIFSLYGIIDLLSIIPSYVSLIIPEVHYLQVVRIIRVLRIFRVLKLVKYLGAAEQLNHALSRSVKKITVFLVNILTLVIILGAIMYLIEGPENGFSSIPKSIYWAIVTITTVGYGDISPQTPLGQFIAAIIMLIGFGIIAIPTGIVTAELAQANMTQKDLAVCPQCTLEGHESDAVYCRKCACKLIS